MQIRYWELGGRRAPRATPGGQDDARPAVRQSEVDPVPGPRVGERPRKAGPSELFLTEHFDDAYEGVPINSLAYAGALFAREAHQLQAIRDIGPLNVLRAVSMN